MKYMEEATFGLYGHILIWSTAPYSLSLGGVLAVLPDDFLIGLQVNVVMRENCAML